MLKREAGRRERTRIRLAKTRRGIAGIRRDWRPASRRIADSAYLVAVKDLRVEAMTRSAWARSRNRENTQKARGMKPSTFLCKTQGLSLSRGKASGSLPCPKGTRVRRALAPPPLPSASLAAGDAGTAPAPGWGREASTANCAAGPCDHRHTGDIHQALRIPKRLLAVLAIVQDGSTWRDAAIAIEARQDAPRAARRGRAAYRVNAIADLIDGIGLATSHTTLPCRMDGALAYCKSVQSLRQRTERNWVWKGAR